MTERELQRLKRVYHKVKKRKPWANEDLLSGSVRLGKDVLYTSASAAIPHAAGKNALRLKNNQLKTLTAAGSLVFNMFVSKTGDLFKSLDFTRSAAYDIVDFKRFMLLGSNHEFDPDREYNVYEYFKLREKLRQEGSLPHKWQYTFDSIPEDGITMTDKAVASVFSLYLIWQKVIGGPVSYDRMHHWWNVETRRPDAEDRAIYDQAFQRAGLQPPTDEDFGEIQREMGVAYQLTQRMRQGEDMDNIRQAWGERVSNYAESAYIPDDA